MRASYKHTSRILNNNVFPFLCNFLKDKVVYDFTYVCNPLFATQICLQKQQKGIGIKIECKDTENKVKGPPF